MTGYGHEKRRMKQYIKRFSAVLCVCVCVCVGALCRLAQKGRRRMEASQAWAGLVTSTCSTP